MRSVSLSACSYGLSFCLLCGAACVRAFLWKQFALHKRCVGVSQETCATCSLVGTSSVRIVFQVRETTSASRTEPERAKLFHGDIWGWRWLIRLDWWTGMCVSHDSKRVSETLDKNALSKHWTELWRNHNCLQTLGQMFEVILSGDVEKYDKHHWQHPETAWDTELLVIEATFTVTGTYAFESVYVKACVLQCLLSTP